MSDDEDLTEIDFVFDAAFEPKNAFGGDMERMVDDTLFRCVFSTEQQVYHIISSTPVEGHPQPLKLKGVVYRQDAKRHAEQNFMKGLSTDTAALEIGIELLTPQIAYQVRKLREDELVGQELEAIEGFGSF
jgi:hypothetical protein